MLQDPFDERYLSYSGSTMIGYITTTTDRHRIDENIIIGVVGPSG